MVVHEKSLIVVWPEILSERLQYEKFSQITNH